MSDDIKNYPEIQAMEIVKLKKQVIDLEIKLKNYETILKENDLIDEIDFSNVNTVEVICVSEINKLKEISDKGGLLPDDVKMLDLLHKNLLLARGKEPEKASKGKKKDKVDVGELLSIVTGDKK